MGRPTKLNPKTQTKFIQGLKLGLTYELAASYAGVDRTTIFNWMRRGKEDEDGIYFDFFNAVKQSEGLCAAQCMTRIIRAAENGQWQAAGWIMERRYGYSAKQEINVASGDDGLDSAEELISKVAQVAQQLQASKDADD
jgi:hypothetical protein|tara:strand:- start:222 stop:638 length:417 start_codon:yes stop_codon:yes gene_type:complete